MILGFKKQFVEPIINGTKIHTIREDKTNRWKKDRVIQMSTGVRTKQYKQFAEKICTGVRSIEINPINKTVSMIVNGTEEHFFNDKGIDILSKNDGFNSSAEFWEWFNKPFKGKLIYWDWDPYFIEQ